MQDDNVIQILQLLINRINHLEVMLFSSMLGILLTTTYGVFAAFYKIQESGNNFFKPTYFIIGINLIYVFISGYYYFILTHFYAAASTLIQLKPSLPTSLSLEIFWELFKVPKFPFWFSDPTRNLISLANAPLFPLMFSFTSIMGICYLLKRKLSKTQKKYTYWVIYSLLIQLVPFYLIILYPFLTFVEILYK